jgi:Heme/copper-type cytochrome/quinol oxidases, subunit 1
MLASLILFIIGFTMGGLNYVVTVLQARTRGMTLMRMPLTVWGIFTATVMALLAFPALFVASVMLLLDRLLGTSFFMPTLVEMGQADEIWRWQPDPVPAPFLVLRPSRSLHRRLAGLRHHFRSDQRPRAEEHLRLSHDGLGIVGIGALSFVVGRTTCM